MRVNRFFRWSIIHQAFLILGAVIMLRLWSYKPPLSHTSTRSALSVVCLWRCCYGSCCPLQVWSRYPRPLWPSLLFSASLPPSLSLSFPLSLSPSVERLTTPAPPAFPPSLSRPFARSLRSSCFLSSSSWSSFLLFSRSFMRSARSKALCVAWEKSKVLN